MGVGAHRSPVRPHHHVRCLSRPVHTTGCIAGLLWGSAPGQVRGWYLCRNGNPGTSSRNGLGPQHGDLQRQAAGDLVFSGPDCGQSSVMSLAQGKGRESCWRLAAGGWRLAGKPLSHLARANARRQWGRSHGLMAGPECRSLPSTKGGAGCLNSAANARPHPGPVAPASRGPLHPSRDAAHSAAGKGVGRPGRRREDRSLEVPAGCGDGDWAPAAVWFSWW